MSERRWFVMLRGGDDLPIPLVGGGDDEDGYDDKPALFTSEREAEEAGSANMFGRAYGFETYEW